MPKSTTYSSQHIALVLGSGGAKGYAHIGAIKAIEEKGYTVTSVAGTSMGALVGGLYAAGKLKEAYAWLKTIDNWQVFKLADIKNISKKGIIDGEYIFKELHKLVGDVRIEDLPIPFCAVAVDLDSGKEKVFTKGNLLDAIRASISVPAFFAPHVIRGRRYVDGGIVNGLPINRVKRTPGDKVIAINLETYGETTSVALRNELTTTWFANNDFAKYIVAMIMAKMPKMGVLGPMVSTYLHDAISGLWDKITSENLLSILLNSFYISLKHNKQEMVERENPDIYINIDLKGYSAKNFSEAEAISYLGYTQMRKKLLE